jgi:hypothetical protein
MLLFSANPRLQLQVVATDFLSIVAVMHHVPTDPLQYPRSVLNSFIKQLEFQLTDPLQSPHVPRN